VPSRFSASWRRGPAFDPEHRSRSERSRSGPVDVCHRFEARPCRKYRFASPFAQFHSLARSRWEGAGRNRRSADPRRRCSITSASTVGLPREIDDFAAADIDNTTLMGILRAGHAGIDAGEETPRRMSKQGFLERLLFHRRVQFLERGQERGHAIQGPGHSGRPTRLSPDRDASP